MKFMDYLIKILPSRPVYAHCDIPCGIYDPHAAQLAAKTVLTMVQKIKELDSGLRQNDDLDGKNNFVRMVMVKEQHAETCKREILILWTDYFKSEHLGKFPTLHDLVWKTAKLCSDNKRAIDETKATKLVEAVDRIADIFEKTHNK